MGDLINFINKENEKTYFIKEQITFEIAESPIQTEDLAKLLIKVEEDIIKKQYHFMDYGKFRFLYHDLFGISSSNIRKYMKNPYSYYFDKTNWTLRKETKAKNFGKLIHRILLEHTPILGDDGINNMFSDVSDPKEKKRKINELRLQKAQEGHIILPKNEFDMLKHWTKSFENEFIFKMLKGGSFTVKEVPIFVKCPHTCLLLKFCPDILKLDSSPFIADLKTNGREFNWRRVVETYGYDYQAAYYIYCLSIVLDMGFEKAVEKVPFYFICMDKFPPYTVSVKMIGKERLVDCINDIIGNLHNMKNSFIKAGKYWGSSLNKEIEVAE